MGEPDAAAAANAASLSARALAAWWRLVAARVVAFLDLPFAGLGEGRWPSLPSSSAGAPAASGRFLDATWTVYRSTDVIVFGTDVTVEAISVVPTETSLTS